MTGLARKLVLAAALAGAAAPAGGCATIAGTAVSPITGGVDLTRLYLDPGWYGGAGAWGWSPFVFLGGMVAGPFVALYNGIQHDVSIFRSWPRYWRDFDMVFRPFEMIGRP